MNSFEYGPPEIALTVILSVAVYVYYGITAAKIFAKGGVESWQAWVPFLNSWRLLELGGKPGWWLLIGFIPVIGQILYLVIYIIAQHNIGRALGKSGSFVVLAILLSPVWFGILAFDRSVWSASSESAASSA